MTFGRRYCWINNKYDKCVSEIQEPPKQKEHIELCSIPNKDNKIGRAHV